MMTITQTQFWITGGIIIVAMAILGYLFSRFVMKCTDQTKNMIYAVVGMLIGVAVSAGLWFTIVEKTPATDAKKNVIAAHRLNSHGDDIHSPKVDVEKYVETMEGY